MMVREHRIWEVVLDSVPDEGPERDRLAGEVGRELAESFNWVDLEATVISAFDGEQLFSLEFDDEKGDYALVEHSPTFALRDVVPAITQL